MSDVVWPKGADSWTDAMRASFLMGWNREKARFEQMRGIRDVYIDSAGQVRTWPA